MIPTNETAALPGAAVENQVEASSPDVSIIDALGEVGNLDTAAMVQLVAPATLAITLGHGTKVEFGKAVAVRFEDLAHTLARHDGSEAWIIAATFDGGHRTHVAWRGSSAFVVDIDHRTKGEPTPAEREQLRAIAAKLGATLWHDTPHGLRVWFVPPNPCSDAVRFMAAAKRLADRFDFELAGSAFEVDRNATLNRAQLMFAPNAHAKGVQRRAEVHFSGAVLDVDELLRGWSPPPTDDEQDAAPVAEAPSNDAKEARLAEDLARAKFVLDHVFPRPDELPYLTKEGPSWLRINMACASLGRAGEDLARRWNRRGQKYAGSADDAKAAGFDGSVTIASLFKFAEAKDSTWRARFRSEQAAGHSSDLDDDAAPAKGNDAPAIIMVDAGATERMLAQAEGALLRSPIGKTLFQRGGQLVRKVRRSEPARLKGCALPAGTLHLVAVTATWLERAFESVCYFMRQPAEGPPRRVGCPTKLAEKYLADVGSWGVPSLAGIVTAPTLRPDGSVIQEPGYDMASGILFDPLGVSFPPVPDAPTRAEAAAALARVLETVQTFPFVAEHDRSAWVAALLTAVVRHVVGAAPMFGIDATTAGSGKSTLADGVTIVANGQPAACMTLSRGDDNELRKSLFAMLVAGTPNITLDNITEPIDSAALASTLTQPTFRGRHLGQSQMADVPTSATFIATGNALSFVGDLARRVIPIALDPGCEHPDSRKFDANPREVWAARRAELVVDVLTVLRAYIVAGEPGADALPPYGSFERWSRIVRAPLVWLGMADPLDGRERLRAADPVADGLRRLLGAWDGLFKTRELTAAELLKALDAADPFAPVGPEAAAAESARAVLVEALREMIGADHRPLDAVRVGKALRVHRRRIVAGLMLDSRTGRGGTLKWSVQPAPAAPRGREGSEGSGGVPTYPKDLLTPLSGVGEGGKKVEGHGLTPPDPSDPSQAPAALDLAYLAEVLD